MFYMLLRMESCGLGHHVPLTSKFQSLIVAARRRLILEHEYWLDCEIRVRRLRDAHNEH